MLYSENEIREQICLIGRRMYERGMVAANDGNISVRLGAHEILCTPTGVSKGYMTPDSLCVVDPEGNVIRSNGISKPSSEMKMHLRVFARRPDVNAVVHAHPPYATTFAILEKPLDAPIMTEAVVAIGEVPLAPFATPSTSEVPDSIEPFLPDHHAVLLAHHGALTWAADLETAYMHMETVENYALQLYQTALLGNVLGASPLIRDEDVEKLRALR